MLVKDYMTRHPIMIAPDNSIVEAQSLMVEYSIRHLPVVGDGKRLLGLITPERLNLDPAQLGSLDVWEITRYLSALDVKKVMAKGSDLHTIDPYSTLEEAAAAMMENKCDGLVVIEDGIVVGVITLIDLLDALRNLLGANDDGYRIVVRVPARKGEFLKLNSAIAERGWSTMAMGSVRTPKKSDSWDIILKVRFCTREELIDLIDALPDQELIDIRETTVYTE